MASKFGGMQPPQCPRAFTMALTGGVMDPRPAHTFDAFRLEPPPGGLWRGVVRLALRPALVALGLPGLCGPLPPPQFLLPPFIGSRIRHVQGTNQGDTLPPAQEHADVIEPAP